jgi:hypothetical protein
MSRALRVKKLVVHCSELVTINGQQWPFFISEGLISEFRGLVYTSLSSCMILFYKAFFRSCVFFYQRGRIETSLNNRT